MMEKYQEWIGKALVWESPVTGKEEFLIAKGYTPDENHPHHTPRFWYRGIAYLAEYCKPLPEMDREMHSMYMDEFKDLPN